MLFSIQLKGRLETTRQWLMGSHYGRRVPRHKAGSALDGFPDLSLLARLPFSHWERLTPAVGCPKGCIEKQLPSSAVEIPSPERWLPNALARLHEALPTSVGFKPC
ncbi:MAG: hypothetical protein V7K21_24900 [Nostoc sp.]|uniref:hypothetical protein n=1 Tax=Nostoc sp. TaxID=1180 RepID=UPI002FFC6C4A